MKGKNRIITGRYESPCGTLMLGSLDDRLCLCDWQMGHEHNNRVNGRLRRMLGADFEDGSSAVIDKAKTRLDEYFAGARREFDVPLLFAGTDFQKRVWAALLTIPYGQMVSYGEMARRIGMPTAVRAVANANGANAISIFAPCHRVIGNDRKLTGYAGGLAAKTFLLQMESAMDGEALVSPRTL